MGKRNNENSDNCGVKDCILFEKQVLQNRVQEVGCEWNLTGILGSEGEGEGSPGKHYLYSLITKG